MWWYWRMWPTRTITGERGLRRDWKNISSRCYVACVEIKIFHAFVLFGSLDGVSPYLRGHCLEEA